jgi:UDP-N-acetylmuramate dehydrogenase
MTIDRPEPRWSNHPVELLEQHPLDTMNTFGLAARARWFARARSLTDVEDILALSRDMEEPLMFLGGGSNLVLGGDVAGLVLKIEIPGIEVIDDNGREVIVRVGAGEDWPSLVQVCLDAGWYGLENLALIPGTAGAAPVQNIGAYGVELREFLVGVEAIDAATSQRRTIANEDCGFGYRTSVFKQDPRDRLVLTGILLRLSRIPRIRATYPALVAELEALGIPEPSPVDVANAVSRVRRRRLPDPAIQGNAGSFFQNPIVDATLADSLATRFPGMPSFPEADGRVKLAAAWLIEQCGFKGAVRGRAGVHPDHALVLVNRGGATGREVLELAEEIRAGVRDSFGITLDIEPRVVGVPGPARRIC